jgi:hypothetical protein
MESGGTHAIVEQVKIEAVDGKTVSFATRTASKSGHADDCLLRRFTCPSSEVWAAPIPGAPPPVAMQPGATGNLFLSRAGWATPSIDGYQIFGADADPVFKYPSGAAGRPAVNPLTVHPSRLVVRGAFEGTSTMLEIDLLGPEGAPPQDIVWYGADCIEVRLTQRGSQRLRGRSEASTLRLWPTQLVVTGAPASDPAILGEVDVLNGELAGRVQHITFAKHGAPISLALTQDGFSAFHVVPGLDAAAPTLHRASHRH